MIHITFGEVLEALKDGKTATKADWTSILILVKDWSYKIPIEDNVRKGMSFIAITDTLTGRLLPYIPTQSDMSASDWKIIN